MMKRVYRWRQKLLIAAAMVPLCQATGTCDATALNQFIGQQLLSATFSVVVGSIQQTLVTSFPSSDIIQGFLGGNPQPIIR